MSKRKASFSEKSTPPKKTKKTSMINPPRKKIGPEKKNVDLSSTAQLIAAQTTATVTLLNGIDDGATSSTRIGRRVNLVSLTYRFSGSMAATTAGGSPIRLLIVYDRQPNGATPAITDIVILDTISSTMNLANSKRFKVLVDDCSQQIGTAGPQSFYISGFRRLNLDMEFNDNSTATITSIQEGAIFAIVWQNGNLITANPTNSLITRIRFTDV